MSVNFQELLSKHLALSDDELQILGDSPYLGQLRTIKNSENAEQIENTRDALMSLFDKTTDEENTTSKSVTDALDSTHNNHDPIIEVDTAYLGEKTIVVGMRCLIMAIVLNRFIMNNIDAISTTDTMKSLQNRKDRRTQTPELLGESRKISANNIERQLIGEFLYIDDNDADLSTIDPNIAYIIAKKELEISTIIRTIYDELTEVIDEIDASKKNLEKLIENVKDNVHKEKKDLSENKGCNLLQRLLNLIRRK